MAGRPIGRRQLQQVEPSDLNALYALLLAGDADHRPLSGRSVRYIATVIHRALRDAVRWQALVRNPADSADPPKPTARLEMRTWTAPELSAFLDHVGGDRLAGGWWLLATTGMRRGEALGLRWSDVDLENGVARITRTLITTDVQRKGSPGFGWGTRKTAKGRRSMALDPATVAALKAHRTRQLQERMALGAGYVDEDSSWPRSMVARCTPSGSTTTSSGSPSGRGCQPSGCTTCGTRTRPSRSRRACTRGIVQERLGHANVSITLDTYSHVDQDMQAAAALRVAARISGGQG